MSLPVPKNHPAFDHVCGPHPWELKAWQLYYRVPRSGRYTDVEEFASRSSILDASWETRKGIDSETTPQFDNDTQVWDKDLLDQLSRESELRNPYRRGTSQDGVLITIPVRFATGDGESTVSQYDIGIGTAPGRRDVMPYTSGPLPIHISMAPHPSWKHPDEYDQPGVYNAMKVGQYVEAWVRVPTHQAGSPQWYSKADLPSPTPTKLKGLFAVIRVHNKAKMARPLIAIQPVVHDTTPPNLIPDRVKEGLNQGSINSRF